MNQMFDPNPQSVTFYLSDLETQARRAHDRPRSGPSPVLYRLAAVAIVAGLIIATVPVV